jgi:hypothetical protein
VSNGSVNGGDLALSGSISCFCGYAVFPDRIGSGRVSNPTVNRWFDPTAFVDQTVDGSVHAFGNSGRNILRGPRFVNFDLSLGKSFRVREGMNLEVRADSYNAFNHPQFVGSGTNPVPVDNNILSSTAGQITSAQGANNFLAGRVIQLGGRFTF